MVAYCCVKGCKSHGDHNKKDPDNMTSFHAFPSNIELRQKWLRAIGRPDWSPPTYSRVCSVHFSFEQIKHEGLRTRIKEDAIPNRDLPANSKFEASEVEVCRFCLAADVRLYSLQDGVHRLYLESLAAYNDNYNIEGLPQFICYECAPHLKKSYNLLQKSFTVQATLLDIFARYGEITIKHINKMNRKELNLSSPLSIDEIIVEDNLKSVDITDDISIPKVEVINLEMHLEEEVTNLEMHPENIQNTEKCEASNLNNNEDEDIKMDEDWLDDEYINAGDSSSDGEVKPECENTKVKKTEESKEKKAEGLTSDKVNMQENFNVVPLTANSKFEASEVEVCRFCLAADVRLYSLQDGVHRLYLESLAAYNDNYNIEGLPQFICYECAPHLKKSYNLLQKSFTVQATLLDIFARYGEITIKHINKMNRKELNLSSPLSIDEIIVEDNLKSVDITDDISIPKVEVINLEMHLEEEVTNLEMHPENIQNTEKCEASNLNNNEDEDIKMDEDWLDDEYINAGDSSSDGEVKPECENTKVKKTEESKEKKAEGLTSDKVNMQENFNVVPLTLDQQIEEWQNAHVKKQVTEGLFTCETCSKTFLRHSSYLMHKQGHDPARGSAECPVCKLRYKNAVKVRSHAKRAHAKKFHCKQCPKAFNNVVRAKQHLLWHSGRVYRCGSCTFSTTNASSLHHHARAHGGVACARCGRAFVSERGLLVHQRVHAVDPDSADSEDSPKYRCEQCGVDFRSEGARRVHLLTSERHKKKTTSCDATPEEESLKNTCNKCGVKFPSLKQLVEHSRAEHKSGKYRNNWRLPDDSHPTKCEHCDFTVNTRFEHWRHVRRAHPTQRAAYRALITAVCELCGKGFQNISMLKTHEARHAAPAVPCAACPRLFYDKYALARHMLTHADAKPHRCQTCGLAFKQRSNLERHSRVHTGLTPYECSLCGKKFKYSSSMNLHVRTVHYKLPHPPRKRRNNKLDESDSNNGK